ncbi:hypothetical protein C7A17_10505 [Ectopseudomonas mendocina]|uniref:Uncharacterized protein n=2 Tax=Ectopseudomonas mendocina TaxID=300 RepID=A0A2R3QN44_ECTME|nr:hypothetical protein C7A17_10505 [Pseudomonas mendocina]
MGVLWAFYKYGGLSADTEVSPFLATLINWRYSEDSFSFLIILSFIISCLAITFIRTAKIPKHEKLRLAMALSLIAKLMNNMLLFWAGVFIAWSFGSRLIPFIPAIKEQEVMAALLIPVAIWFKYQIIKLKHWSVND